MAHSSPRGGIKTSGLEGSGQGLSSLDLFSVHWPSWVALVKVMPIPIRLFPVSASLKPSSLWSVLWVDLVGH